LGEGKCTCWPVKVVLQLLQVRYFWQTSQSRLTLEKIGSLNKTRKLFDLYSQHSDRTGQNALYHMVHVHHPLTLTATPREIFIGQMPFLSTNQQRQSTEGILPSSVDCHSVDMWTNEDTGWPQWFTDCADTMTKGPIAILSVILS